MNITKNDDPIEYHPMPARPFIAQLRSIDGPLCIVTERHGHGDARFGAFFLEGHGGPAIWDEWSKMTEETVRLEFIPVKYSITLRNAWPTITLRERSKK